MTHVCDHCGVAFVSTATTWEVHVEYDDLSIDHMRLFSEPATYEEIVDLQGAREEGLTLVFAFPKGDHDGPYELYFAGEEGEACIHACIPRWLLEGESPPPLQAPASSSSGELLELDVCGDDDEGGDPGTLTGRLVYRRTWDNVTGQTIEPVVDAMAYVKVELHGTDGGGEVKTTAAKDDGSFRFEGVDPARDYTVRVYLDDPDMVTVKGLSEVIDDAVETFISPGEVVWYQHRALDLASADTSDGEIALGDVEVTNEAFIALAFCFGTVCRGYRRLSELGINGQQHVTLEVPSPDESKYLYATGAFRLLPGDYTDPCIILHEYSHFLDHELITGGFDYSYDYNDRTDDEHGWTDKEHHEAAWAEGCASFLACVLLDDSRYRDTHDMNSVHDLEQGVTTVGAHSEGSVAEALWRFYKLGSPKPLFYRVWNVLRSDVLGRKVTSAVDFFLAMRELESSYVPQLLSAYHARGMEYVTVYEAGWAWDQDLDALDEEDKDFGSVEQLYERWGSFGGGTLSDYQEEFWNRNRSYNDESPLSQDTQPTKPLTQFCRTGRRYVIPKRARVTASGLVYQGAEASTIQSWDDVHDAVLRAVMDDAKSVARIDSWFGTMNVDIFGIAGSWRNYAMSWGDILGLLPDSSEAGITALACTGIADATSEAINSASIPGVRAISISREMPIAHDATRVDWTKPDGTVETKVYDWHATLNLDDPAVSSLWWWQRDWFSSDEPTPPAPPAGETAAPQPVRLSVVDAATGQPPHEALPQGATLSLRVDVSGYAPGVPTRFGWTQDRDSTGAVDLSPVDAEGRVGGATVLVAGTAPGAVIVRCAFVDEAANLASHNVVHLQVV